MNDSGFIKHGYLCVGLLWSDECFASVKNQQKNKLIIIIKKEIKMKSEPKFIFIQRPKKNNIICLWNYVMMCD